MTKTKATTIQDTSIIKRPETDLEKAVDIPGLIQQFLDAQDIRAISKEVYRKGLERFLSWQESNQITNPRRTDLLNFKEFLKQGSLSVNTNNSCLTAVKRFFAFLHAEKGYPDITQGLKGFKQAKGHLREPFTETQVEEIFNNIDDSTIQGKRDFVILTVMAETGMRVSSVVQLDFGDIKTMEKGEAKIFYYNKGKDEKDGKSLLQETVVKDIMAYIKLRGKVKADDPLFISHSDRNEGQRLTTRTISRIVKNLLIKAKIDDPRLCAHSLRHFFATNSYQHGGQLYSISQAMGHASISTTQIYLHDFDRMGENAAERFVTYKRREINWA